jgi:hypothetical protein
VAEDAGVRTPVLIAALLLAPPVRADGLRVATWDIGLTRDGPGLLLADLAGPDSGLRAAVAVIRAVRPDVLLLNGFDHDLHGRALAAFTALLREGPDGIDYPETFAAPVNAGAPSGRDLDGDGRLMQPEDAFGWGRFPGHGGMAILSRLPIDAGAARTFRLLPWAALPGADLPERDDGTAFPDPATRDALRLSSRAHWDVPVVLEDGTRLHLLASNPTPPLFDGPEGFNRRRNGDEIRFWSAYLGGEAFPDDAGRTAGPPEGPFILLGDLNLDPRDGEGQHDAMTALLAQPRLQDPRPRSAGAAASAREGVNGSHDGDPALDTADWRDDGPGNLRVDYVLPSADLRVSGAGVFWPPPGAPLAAEAGEASDHHLVWVELALP